MIGWSVGRRQLRAAAAERCCASASPPAPSPSYNLCWGFCGLLTDASGTAGFPPLSLGWAPPLPLPLTHLCQRSGLTALHTCMDLAHVSLDSPGAAMGRGPCPGPPLCNNGRRLPMVGLIAGSRCTRTHVLAGRALPQAGAPCVPCRLPGALEAALSSIVAWYQPMSNQACITHSSPRVRARASLPATRARVHVCSGLVTHDRTRLMSPHHSVLPFICYSSMVRGALLP